MYWAARSARLATGGSGRAAAAQRRLQSTAAAKRAVVGIRLEDKNRWERRVPLTPAHVQRLVDNGVRVLVQTSTRRVFPDEEFRRVRLARPGRGGLRARPGSRGGGTRPVAAGRGAGGRRDRRGHARRRPGAERQGGAAGAAWRRQDVHDVLAHAQGPGSQHADAADHPRPRTCRPRTACATDGRPAAHFGSLPTAAEAAEGRTFG